MRLSAFNQNSLYGFKVLTEFEYLQFTCTTSCKAKVRPNEGEIIKPNGAGSKIIVQWKWETGMRFAGAIHHSKGIGYIKNNRKSSSYVVTFALRFFFPILRRKLLMKRVKLKTEPVSTNVINLALSLTLFSGT